MSQIVARIEITQDDTGTVHVEGTGQQMRNKAFAYGLLELAKDVIRDNSKPKIERPSASDLAQFPH
jgi:hypothetical protein